MFARVAIVGFGLIGSSIARALRRHNLAVDVVCVDRDEDVCHRVAALGLAGEVTTDPATGVHGADLVILSVPVGANAGVADSIAESLKPGAIVMDVGSVKRAAVDAISAALPATVHFIPAHPIAGSEHSGPEAGFAELFKDRWCILTPAKDASLIAMEKIRAMWETFGARPALMTPDQHDLTFAAISHMPQMLAYTAVSTAADIEAAAATGMLQYFGNGFRDTTRIAASDPVMWRDICLFNRDALLQTLDRFSENLDALKSAIRAGDAEELQKLFERPSKIRRGEIFKS